MATQMSPEFETKLWAAMFSDDEGPGGDGDGNAGGNAVREAPPAVAVPKAMQIRSPTLRAIASIQRCSASAVPVKKSRSNAVESKDGASQDVHPCVAFTAIRRSAEFCGRQLDRIEVADAVKNAVQEMNDYLEIRFLSRISFRHQTLL